MILYRLIHSIRFSLPLSLRLRLCVSMCQTQTSSKRKFKLQHKHYVVLWCHFLFVDEIFGSSPLPSVEFHKFITTSHTTINCNTTYAFIVTSLKIVSLKTRMSFLMDEVAVVVVVFLSAVDFFLLSQRN